MTGLSRRTVLKAGAVAAGAAALPVGLPGAAEAVPHGASVLATGMQVPWGIVFPDSSSALVGERDTCAIYRVGRTGGKRLVGQLDTRQYTRLMGLAKSPWFSTDRFVYAVVRTAGDLRVVRMTYSTAGVLGTPQTTFAGIPLGADHLGGGIAFGPDRMLYVSVGDMATPDLARNPGSMVGKILRMRPAGGLPPGNPFPNSYVWSMGHRNVECMTWDGTGRMLAVEFGESTTDELDVIVPGGDYGWPDYEGGDGAGPVQEPFATWSPTSSCSPAGVAVKGDYAYVTALAGQALFTVKLTAPNAGQIQRYYYQTYRRLRSVAVAPDGALWVTTANNTGTFPRATTDDRVLRILT